MKMLFFLSLLFTLSGATLLRTLESNIIINDLAFDESCENSPISIKLILSNIPNEFNIEESELNLQSTSGTIATSNSCSVEDNAIKCSVNVSSGTQYSFKNFTSKGYTYTSNIPSTSIVQLSTSYDDIDNYPELFIKGKSFELSLTTPTSNIAPPLFFKINNNYIQIPCSSVVDSKITCSLPLLDITITNPIEIYKREACGQFSTNTVKSVSIDNTFSFSGSQYINVELAQDYYYTVQLGSVVNTIDQIKLKATESLNLSLHCLPLSNTMYNCTISKEVIISDNIGNYYLYFDDKLLMKDAAVILYKSKGVPQTEINKGELSLTEKNSITINFTHVTDSTFKDDIKITIQSNSLLAENNCSLTKEGSNLDLLYECTLTTPENCTVSYYYLNSTNGLNKIGDLLVGNGMPYYDSSRFIRLCKISFLTVSLLLIV